MLATGLEAVTALGEEGAEDEGSLRAYDLFGRAFVVIIVVAAVRGVGCCFGGIVVIFGGEFQGEAFKTLYEGFFVF